MRIPFSASVCILLAGCALTPTAPPPTTIPRSTQVPATSTPSPTVTHTPTPTLTPTPAPPSAMGTPLELPSQVISAGNARSLSTRGVLGYGSPLAFAWSPRGDYFAVGTMASVLLYPADVIVPSWLSFTDDPVTCLEFSPDGTLLAAATGKVVILYEVPSMVVRAELGTHAGAVTDIAFSPDATLLATVGSTSLRLWDPATGSRLQAKELDDWVTALAFAPQGGALVTSLGSSSVTVWDPISMEQLGTLKGLQDISQQLLFSPDGKLLVGVGTDSIVLFDFTSYKRLRSIGRGLQSGREGHQGEMSISLDGAYAAYVNWDTSRADTLCVADFPYFSSCLWTVWFPDAQMPGYPIQGSAFSPDGSTLAVLTKAEVILRDKGGRGAGVSLGGFAPWLFGLSVSPDGRHLATSSRDSVIRVWSLPETTIAQEILAQGWLYRRVKMSPSGDVVAGVGFEVHAWPLGGEGRDVTLTTHYDVVTDIALSSDGALIASSSWDSTVRLVDAFSRRTLFQLRGPTDWTYSVALDTSGSLVAAGGGFKDPRVFVWDAREGTLLQALEGHPTLVTAVAFSPAGDLLATADDTGQVRLWAVYPGRISLLEVLPALLQGEFHVNALAFSPDGTLLAVAITSADNRGRVCISSVDPVRNLACVQGSTYLGNMDVTFSPDQRFIYSASGDGVVRAYAAFP